MAILQTITKSLNHFNKKGLSQIHSPAKLNCIFVLYGVHTGGLTVVRMIAQTYTPLFLRQEKSGYFHIKNRVGLKAILWLLPVLLCIKEVQAQSYIADVRKLSVEDGLSNRFTRSICKDSRGFIWIATRYGLNRYDGYGFKHYTKENSDLSTDDINIINEDTQQRLWILHNKRDSQRSIDILNINTGRIEHFDTVFNTRVPFKPEFVTDIYADAEKTLWIKLKSGKIYRYKDKEFDHITTFGDSKRSKNCLRQWGFFMVVS